MTLAIASFAVSFVGIAGLFALKYREEKAGRVYLPSLRDSADEKAVAFKGWLARRGKDLELLPPFAAMLARRGVHELALSFAAIARMGETQAHRLADLVSHKHRFERRAPRSEFLMRVAQRGSNDAGVSVAPTPVSAMVMDPAPESVSPYDDQGIPASTYPSRHGEAEVDATQGEPEQEVTPVAAASFEDEERTSAPHDFFAPIVPEQKSEASAKRPRKTGGRRKSKKVDDVH